MAVSILGQVDDRFIWNTFNSNDMVWLARFWIGLNSAGAGKRQASELLMSENPSGISRLVVFGDSLSDNGNLFRFTGEPAPPYWEGRFSNGPTYAEQLANELGAKLDDLAFGGATASGTSPFANPLPINLPEQIAAYFFELGGRKAPAGTTAVIDIGSNDYINFLESGASTAEIPNLVKSVKQSVKHAINALTAAGVEKIALFTLPDLSVTPEIQALAANPMAPPGLLTLARELDVANNQALAELAASHPNVQLVDIFKLTDAVAADPLSFGFSDTTIPMINLISAGVTNLAPNEIAFFDGLHPTYAAHGVQAAFAHAVLTSDHTQFLDGTQSLVHAQNGSDFVFATPIDPTNPSLTDKPSYGVPMSPLARKLPAGRAINIRRPRDAAFGDDGGDQARRRHVKCGIGHVHVGRDAHAADVRYFLGGALLDRDVFAARDRKVQRGDGRGHVKRHAIFSRQDGDLVGADLVRGVAIRGDAVRAHDDRRQPCPSSENVPPCCR